MRENTVVDEFEVYADNIIKCQSEYRSKWKILKIVSSQDLKDFNVFCGIHF
jgi:hypothetical protein